MPSGPEQASGLRRGSDRIVHSGRRPLQFAYLISFMVNGPQRLIPGSRLRIASL